MAPSRPTRAPEASDLDGGRVENVGDLGPEILLECARRGVSDIGGMFWYIISRCVRPDFCCMPEITEREESRERVEGDRRDKGDDKKHRQLGGVSLNPPTGRHPTSSAAAPTARVET